MVCRENKGRSANLAIFKSVHFALTGERIHDSEVQSIQHELRHEVEDAEVLQKYDNFDSWSKEDQIAAWKDLRTQVDNLPDDLVSDGNKYRVSHKQPGIATRIDQEIARLESGVHEGTGEKLTKDQTNSGADMLATMRVLSGLERNTPARKNFLENNARRRGMTFKEAEAEWTTLMNRKENYSNISLTDDFRQSMSIAGLDAQDQANFSQSGRARAAMIEMEARAKKHLQDIGPDHRRQALRPEHQRGTYVSPDHPKAKLKCSLCGQFGHDDGSCPNGDNLATLEECDDLENRIDRHQKVISRMKMVAEVPETVQNVLDETNGMTLDEYKLDIAKERDALDEPLMSEVAIQKHRKAIERDRAEAQQEIDDSGIQVSNWIQQVDYNPDNGLLRVVQQPYTKKNGEVSVYPPRYFRARPEAVDALLQNPSIGKGIHEQFLDSNKTKDMHEFENEADLKAALSEVRCPTCGQWASMNSNHRCPVPGGPSEEFDVEKRRRQMDYRAMARAAKNNGEPVPEKPMTVTKAMHHSAPTVKLPDPQDPSHVYAGVLRSGTRKDAQASIASGALYTSSVNFTAADDECHVTGELSAWQDDSGNRIMSIYSAGGSKGLRCTCAAFQANGRCNHIASVGRQLLQKYEARPARRASRPGMSLASIAKGRSEDGSVMSPNRLGYAEIAERRKAATNAYAWEHVQRRKAGQVPGQWVMGKPSDINGQEIDQPGQWARDPSRTEKPGAPVDLNDYQAVRGRLRSLAQSKGGRKKRIPYSVTLDPDGSGAILVNLPPSSLKSGKESIARAQRRKLASLMGVPERAITARGYRVSPNKAARHNALDRMAGDPPRIIPATVAYKPSDADVRASEHRHRVGNDGAFVG